MHFKRKRNLECISSITFWNFLIGFKGKVNFVVVPNLKGSFKHISVEYYGSRLPAALIIREKGTAMLFFMAR